MAEKSRMDRINGMIDAVIKAAEGDFSIRIESSDKNDELDSLAEAINKMVEQVQKRLTQSKRAEKTLKQSRQLLDESQRIAHIGSWDMDIKTLEIIWTDEMFRIFGLRPQEIQITFEEFINRVYPDDRDMISAHFRETQETKKFRSFDYRIMKPDGTVRFVHATGEVFCDEAGTPIRIIGTVRDITERRQLEQALQLTQFCVDRASVGFFRTGPDAKFLSVNDYICQKLGYTREELYNMYVFDIDPDFPRERWLKHRQELRTRGSITFETIHRRKDGTTFPVEITGTYLEFQGEGFSFSFVRDITERKQAEEALRESEARYRQLFELESDAIFLIDNETGYILEANSAASDMYGYSREELLTKKNVDLSAEPEDTQHITQTTPPSSDQVVTVPLRFHRKSDGTVFPVEITGRFFVRQGRSVHIAAIRDITERRQAEEALKQSEHLLKESQKVAQLGHYKFDAITGFWESSEILDEVFGIEADFNKNVEGWLQIVHPDHRDEMFEYLTKNVVKKCQPFDKEYKILRLADNQERWVHGLGRLEFDDEGKPIRMIGTIQDITERKRLEEQLLQSQKMEAIGQLAGGVAHDFNNMLTVILGYAELIKSRLPSGDSLLKDVLEIEKAASHSKDITRQLLAFSRKQIITPRPTNLNELITNTKKTLSRLIGEDIDLRFYPEKELWKINFDPSQIDQILVNLAVNARDALPHGGKLTIETSNVYLDEDYCREHLEFTPGYYVQLGVSDDGIGMDKETLPHVFEPFFTTKEVGKGTGLGLATVYGIVKQNGGVINVYSEPGQGTTFKIYFPRMVEEDEVTEMAEESPRASATGTILVVEDDEMVLKMTTAMLEAIGYTVLVATTSVEALSICEKEDMPIDLLITDVVMPGMNGTKLKDKIEAIRPGIKVLFMSGYTPNVIVHHNMLDEEINFLQKPFSMKDLARKVYDTLYPE